jgi:hypothetical protein
MKNLLAILILSTTAAFGQTTATFTAIAPIAPYQCVALTQIQGRGGIVPCDNTGTDYFNGNIPPAIGVALTASTTCVRGRCGAVTVQTTGSLVVPGANWTIGAFLGDIDGSGNLASWGFVLCTCNGPTSIAGISLDSETIYILPTYIPAAQ